MTCYTRHEIAPGVHQDIPHEHAAKEPTVCEAEEALQRVAYELELQWGAGQIDLGKLKRLTTTGKCAGIGKPETTDSAQTAGKD